MEHQQAPYNQSRKNRLTFAPEDIRVMRQCKTEAFFYRCVPLSAGFCSAVYFLMKNGVIQKNPKYGYIPKLIVAGVLGTFVGRYSYAGKCIEMMKKNDTPFGRYLQNKTNQQNNIFTNMSSSASTENPHPDECYEPKIESEGLFEYNQLADSLSEYSELNESQKNPSYSTYDEMRNSNRNEQMKYRKVYKSEPSYENFEGEQMQVPAPPVRKPFQPTSNNKNQYGDALEE